MTNLNLYAWSGKLPPLPLIGFGAKADEDDDGEMSVGGDTRSESICRQLKLSTRPGAGSYKARLRIPANPDDVFIPKHHNANGE